MPATETPTRRRTARRENRHLPYEAEFDAFGIGYEYVGFIDLDEIERHPESQARIRMAGAGMVNQYAQKQRQGQTFPPVTVWADGAAGYSLLDGNTRVAAKRKNGTGNTDAYVLDIQSNEQAIAISAALNNLSGLQMNKDENRRAMMAMADLGHDPKFIAKKLGVPPADITRALSVRTFDERAERLEIEEEVISRIGKTMKSRIASLADDSVFAEFANLIVEAELQSKDITPLLEGIRTATSEKDRRKVLTDERKNRASDIQRVATGFTVNGSPILESTRAFGMLAKVKDAYPDPQAWVPASDEPRVKWLAALDMLVPFLSQVRDAYIAAAPEGDE